MRILDSDDGSEMKAGPAKLYCARHRVEPSRYVADVSQHMSIPLAGVARTMESPAFRR